MIIEKKSPDLKFQLYRDGEYIHARYNPITKEYDCLQSDDDGETYYTCTHTTADLNRADVLSVEVWKDERMQKVLF